METNIFITENFSTKWPKTRVGRKYSSKYFYQCFVFNKTIIPLMLVGYELMIADSVLHTSSAI